LDAVDAQTGRVVWQKSIAFAAGASDVERLVDIDADPLVDNDMLYIASYQGFLSALSVSQGENVWSRPASTYKNLAMNSNSLFMTDSDDSILSFTRANGQVRWKQLQLKSRVVTAPVLLDSWVLVGDKTGLVHILHANSGEIIGRATLKSSIDVEPVVSDHRVYVLTTSGQLSCYSIGKS
jgi:outer membrane protein assembly factor BamB